MIGFSLLFLAPPAVSQVPDDKLIVPGRGTGKWTMEMTVDDLIRMAGQPGATLARVRHMKTQPGIIALDWVGGLGLGAGTRDRRTILSLYTCAAPKYETVNGVRYGAARQSVESAYGKPTVTTEPHPIGVSLIYDKLGLAVHFHRMVVECIAVFRPGTAKSIWQF